MKKQTTVVVIGSLRVRLMYNNIDDSPFNFSIDYNAESLKVSPATVPWSKIRSRFWCVLM